MREKKKKIEIASAKKVAISRRHMLHIIAVE
jgi:hypothetical protein